MGKRVAERELLREESADEMRVVWLEVSEDGSFTVRERTDGQQTWVAFGTLAREQRVTLLAGEVESLVEALGLEGASGVEGWLHWRFSNGEFLSDIMDQLDRHGVHYGYSVASGAEVAVRAHDALTP